MCVPREPHHLHSSLILKASVASQAPPERAEPASATQLSRLRGLVLRRRVQQRQLQCVVLVKALHALGKLRLCQVVLIRAAFDPPT